MEHYFIAREITLCMFARMYETLKQTMVELSGMRNETWLSPGAKVMLLIKKC